MFNRITAAFACIKIVFSPLNKTGVPLNIPAFIYHAENFNYLLNLIAMYRYIVTKL